MTQIFCEPSEKRADGILLLSGENYHHLIQVLRLRIGEEFSVCYRGEKNEYRYGIEKISGEAAECRLRFIRESDVELPCEITVLQGLPKADKMETVIQKAVELGASRIVPVVCDRTIVRLDERRREEKRIRWGRIAESAAKQSRRSILPYVDAPVPFTAALAIGQEAEIRMFPYELAGEQGASMTQTRAFVRSIHPGQKIAVLIGPEGGFTAEEAVMAGEAGFTPLTLGRRILRTETVAMTILSWLMLELES